MAIDKLAHQIIEFYEKISSWEHGVVKGTGLSPAQMHTIEIIGHEQSLRMKELAEKIGITTGTLTVMIDRLQKLGFVKRIPHEQDRRSFLVVLTQKGEKQFNNHHELHVKLTEEITGTLTSKELENLSTTLGKILPHI